MTYLETSLSPLLEHIKSKKFIVVIDLLEFRQPLAWGSGGRVTTIDHSWPPGPFLLFLRAYLFLH